MNIISSLGAQPPATAQDASGTSGTQPAGDFSSALQQAEAATPEATPSVPTLPTASAPPAPARVPASERPPSSAADLPQVVQQPDAAQAPALRSLAAPGQPPQLSEPPVVEADDSEDPPVQAEPPAALTQTSAAVQEGTDDDDSSTPSRDSLDAIRQRLDLIDNAGALAMAAPLAWVQAPAPNPEPATLSQADYEGTASASVEWPADEQEPPALDLGPASEPTLEAAPATAHAPQQAARDSVVDSPAADAPDSLSLPSTGVSAMASATPANLASPPTLAVAASPLGSTAWQADLGQQVIALVRRGEQQMDMQLNPADLGPLSISLNVSESGIQAQFQSAHASVRTAVEQALPQLQAALATQGLTLGEASVNDGASRQAMGEQPRREPPGNSATARAEEVVQAVASPAPSVPLASIGSGVDLYL